MYSEIFLRMFPPNIHAIKATVNVIFQFIISKTMKIITIGIKSKFINCRNVSL